MGFLKRLIAKSIRKISKLKGNSINSEASELLKKTHPEIYYSNLRSSKEWRIRYRYYVKTQSVAKNWVLYESHAGNGMLCNPLAIFKEFQKRDDFCKYLHIWVISDWDEIDYLREKYKDFSNVLFVKYNSVGYAYFVARAKYLINNTSFNAFFAKRKNQIFLNTWHSITVKHIGYDIPDGKRFVKNILRNLLMADYILSPNEFMTEIFNESFKLKEIYHGKFIEEGYPRNDRVVNTPREEIVKELAERGTVIDPNKKIILYAPTWTGNVVSSPIINVERYKAIATHFQNNIDTDRYQLLIKPHQIEYRNMSEEQLATCNFVSYHIDANELLSVADLVITDYSSIFFDYLAADKPILFYIPDFEEYSKNRGIYFKLDELPGPCAKDLDELSHYVNNLEEIERKYNSRRRETQQWACKYDNGNVSSKVLDVLLDNNSNYNIKSADNTNKKTVLIFPGGLANNSITTAFLSLLNRLDYDKYDVSVFAVPSKTAEQNENLDKIPAHIRLMLQVSQPFLSQKDSKIYNQCLKNPRHIDSKKRKALKEIMQREYMRIFGGAEFDYIIDFSGFGTYFPLLISLGNNNKRTKKFAMKSSDLHTGFKNAAKSTANESAIDLEEVAAHSKKIGTKRL